MTKTTKLTNEQLKRMKRERLYEFTDEVSEWLSDGPVFLGDPFVRIFVQELIRHYLEYHCPEELGNEEKISYSVMSKVEEIRYDEECHCRDCT